MLKWMKFCKLISLQGLVTCRFILSTIALKKNNDGNDISLYLQYVENKNNKQMYARTYKFKQLQRIMNHRSTVQNQLCQVPILSPVVRLDNTSWGQFFFLKNTTKKLIF